MPIATLELFFLRLQKLTRENVQQVKLKPTSTSLCPKVKLSSFMCD